MANQGKTLIGKAQRVQKLHRLASLELDELIEALKNPEILHAELTGRRGEIESKLDRVVDMLIEVKKSTQ